MLEIIGKIESCPSYKGGGLLRHTEWLTPAEMAFTILWELHRLSPEDEFNIRSLIAAHFLDFAPPRTLQ
jgi:hypothetical protein